MKSFVSATAALSLATSALAATYTVVDTYTSDNFLEMFDFEAIPDPTAGRVYALPPSLFLICGY